MQQSASSIEEQQKLLDQIASTPSAEYSLPKELKKRFSVALKD
jgi:hypothetical protein